MSEHPSTTHTASYAALRSWAEIEAAALRHNFGAARACAGTGGEVMAVVKADAYGHGAEMAAPLLEQAGAAAFGVACLDEARKLRAAGVSRPIYILSPVTPGELPAVAAAGLGIIPALSTVEEATAYAALARTHGHSQAVHLVIDTGMGRIGALASEAVEIARRLAALPGLVIDSISSHFPSADEDFAATTAQVERYREVTREVARVFAEAGRAPVRHHLANSAGALTQPRLAVSGDGLGMQEMVRAGLMLYGYSPVEETATGPKLRPVLSWKARVTLVRTLPAGHGISYGSTFITPHPMRVATIAVGYADGYPRAVSGKAAYVELLGERCPVLGRVTMDQILVEAPEGTQPGDVATLLGPGGVAPDAAELARLSDTITWEILTRLGTRVRRLAA